MPAARYWRIVGIAPYVAGGGLELGELQLYGSGARLDAPGMLACSHAPISGALVALSDGEPASACRFAGAHVKSGGFWLGWDVGSAQSVDALRLAGGSAQALYLDTFTLQYSSDAAAWSTVASYGRCQWPGVAQWALSTDVVARPVAALPTTALQRVAAGSMQPFSVRHTARLRFARDTEFGGQGRIWGVNEVEIAPDTRVPTGGRVLLLRQRDKLLARQTWADPVTGAWEFTGLDTRQDFLALAEDLAGNYRPVAASRLTPEVS